MNELTKLMMQAQAAMTCIFQMAMRPALGTVSNGTFISCAMSRELPPTDRRNAFINLTARHKDNVSKVCSTLANVEDGI